MGKTYTVTVETNCLQSYNRILTETKRGHGKVYLFLIVNARTEEICSSQKSRSTDLISGRLNQRFSKEKSIKSF
jgi:hypothetical protein